MPECQSYSRKQSSTFFMAHRVYRNPIVIAFVFTALHVMQTRYCDENSVCPSVCLSVCRSVCLSVCHTREL